MNKLYKRILEPDNDYIQYIFTVNTKSESSISIYKEIIRKKCIDGLFKIFSSAISNLKIFVKKNKLSKLFKYNKLKEKVQKWCWGQYDNKTICDPVIPYVKNNKYKFDVFIEEVIDILGLDQSKKNFIYDKLNNKIIHYLEKYWLKYSELLNHEYSEQFNVENNDTNIIFHYNKFDTLVISKNLYNRLLAKLKKFSPNITSYDTYIFCLVFRYSYIDSGNQQLAIDKKIKDMFAVYGVDFELFGSAINAWSNHYCSLFYDIEKYFGSKGNFFEIDISQGIYWCNPPYDNTIMENAALKLNNALRKNKNICFIVTIPVWDDNTSNKEFDYVQRNINQNLHPSMIKNYRAYSLLKEFVKDELFIPKKRIPYFNHRLNSYIYAVNTYMLLIYDSPFPLVDKLHKVFDNIVLLDKQNKFIIEDKK